MYLEYWGFEKFPFDNVPDPDFFYMSKTHEEGLTRLIYAIERRKGCALLLGDIGCGKTTLCRVLLERISQKSIDVGLLTQPALGPTQLLKEALYQLGITEIPDAKVDILRLLSEKLIHNANENRDTLLVIDEAQTLPESSLEEIRLLLNVQSTKQFFVTVFLVGQVELVPKIKKIKQLAQRIAIKYFLSEFDFEQTKNYILFREKMAGAKRNVFSRQAIEMVFNHSNGVPRKINNLCDLALLFAFGDKKEMITSGVIKDIIEDGTVF